jgi:hypothetical protein
MTLAACGPSIALPVCIQVELLLSIATRRLVFGIPESIEASSNNVSRITVKRTKLTKSIVNSPPLLKFGRIYESQLVVERPALSREMVEINLASTLLGGVANTFQ